MTALPNNTFDPIADATRQQQQAARVDRSVWVSASAGSGKTKLLTDRVLNLLLSGVKPEQVLCLTYTNAAAAEMAGRVSRRLAEWLRLGDAELRQALGNLGHANPDLGRARRLFCELADHPLGLQVSTIHSFCQRLLRRFPLEAKLPASFRVMEKDDSQQLLHEAQRQVLAELPPELRELFVWLADKVHDGAALGLLKTLLQDKLDKFQTCYEAYHEPAKLLEALSDVLGIMPDAGLADLDEILAFGADETALRQACAVLAASDSKTDIANAQVLQDWLDRPQERHSLFDEYQEIFLAQDKRKHLKIRARLATKQAAAALPALTAEAERVLELHHQQQAIHIRDNTRILFGVAALVWNRYAQLKQQSGQYDFGDLILKVSELLENPTDAEWIRCKLDQSVSHILLDEAQDTSPRQWGILNALTGDFFTGTGTHQTPPTLLVVGDDKQSIYSFQGADQLQFRRQQHGFQQRAAAAGQPFPTIDLNVSFRSTDVVLDLVDAVFRCDAARMGVSGTPLRHRAARMQQGGRVELWPLLHPDEADPTPWALPVSAVPSKSGEQQLADAIAARIRLWLDTGERLDSTGQPVRPDDILILLQRRPPLQRELLRALQQANIPVAGADRIRLTDHLAVRDMLALGRFLALPEDDYSLACVLKSPLCGLDEGQLFTLCHNRNGSLWQALRAAAKHDPQLAPVQDWLHHWLGRVGYLLPAELFGQVLASGARDKILKAMGPDALEPLQVFGDRVRQVCQNGASGLAQCLHALDADQSEMRREADTGGVRVMTVHGAKGLEAPIVFLPDTMKDPGYVSQKAQQDENLLLWLDNGLFLWAVEGKGHPAVQELQDRQRQRRLAESNRLLYVALTRAADRLYVCGIHKDPKKELPEHCWYQRIAAGFDALGDEVATEPAPSPFGQVHCLHRPASKRVDRAEAKTPPLPEVPIPDWLDRPAKWEEYIPITPAAADDGAAEPDGFFTPQTKGRDQGILLHLLLQKLPDEPPAHRQQRGLDWLQRARPDLDPAQAEKLVAQASQIITAPHLRDIFGNPGLAEVPLLGFDGKDPLAGRIDRLVFHSDQLILVDYKSDARPAKKPGDVRPVYLQQLGSYARILKDIYPNRTIRACLLWTADCTLMDIPLEMLIK